MSEAKQVNDTVCSMCEAHGAAMIADALAQFVSEHAKYSAQFKDKSYTQIFARFAASLQTASNLFAKELADLAAESMTDLSVADKPF